MRHASSNVTQIDGAKIVRHFANAVSENAILLTGHATAHQVNTDQNKTRTKITILLRILRSKLSKDMCHGFIWHELCI